MITLAQLQAIMPGAGSKAALYLTPLDNAMFEFAIVSPARADFFLAQVAHESGDLNNVEENLNYSAVALYKLWPTHFPTLAVANQYARKPEMIANRAYASRGGNGNEASGDGWRHRGAGLIQLTFLDNQKACADHFGIPLATIGDWLRTPEGACRSAAWFWDSRGCNKLADANDFDGVSDMINIGHKTAAIGDSIGWSDRLADLKLAEKVIA